MKIDIRMRKISFAASLLVLTVICSCGDRERGFDYGPDPAQEVDLWPKWSPVDTATIAYTHVAQTMDELRQYGTYSTWIVDVPSGAKRFIVSGVPHDWTPDGRSILFCKSGGLWTINVSTGLETLISSTPFCRSPRFAPDGSRLSVIKDGKPNYGTWIVVLESDEVAWVSPRYASDWSPDGTELICDSLVIIGADGTRKRKVPHSATMGYVLDEPSWSPDGTLLAVTGKGPAIYVIGLDGSGERIVAQPGAVPSWAPDGERIAYGALSTDRTGMVLWVVNKDGTGKRQITFPYAP